MTTRFTRRNVLATLGVGTATALAGCGHGDGTDDGTDSDDGDDARPPVGDDTGSDGGTEMLAGHVDGQWFSREL